MSGVDYVEAFDVRVDIRPRTYVIRVQMNHTGHWVKAVTVKRIADVPTPVEAKGTKGKPYTRAWIAHGCLFVLTMDHVRRIDRGEDIASVTAFRIDGNTLSCARHCTLFDAVAGGISIPAAPR